MKNMNCTALALGLLGLAVGAAQTHAQSPSYVQFMKAKLKRFPAKLFCAVALGIGSSLSLASAAAREVVSVERGASEDGERESVERGALVRRSDALTLYASRLPWSQLGAKASADYQGDGLGVSATAEGARLRCVFQRLEGEATREGLWLTSTVTNAANDRFRVVATAVRRQSSTVGDEVTSLTSITDNRDGKRQAAAAVQDAIALVHTGMVEVGDKQP